MPRRKKVALLPADVRAELDRMLIDRAFSGYEDLSEWLQGKGYGIGKSALHEYGSHLERRIEQIRASTEQAQALIDSAPDDAGAMSAAALQQVQARIFDMMLAAEGGELKELAATARALADTARAQVSVRQDRRKVLAEAAERAGAAATKAGLTVDTATLIRQAVEGSL